MHLGKIQPTARSRFNQVRVALLGFAYFGSSVFGGIEARKLGCERAYARSQPNFRYFSRYLR
jgi:hypothetical protein